MFHVRVVEVVSDKGIAQVFHMDTDLMGAAGFQLKGDQAVPIFFFYQFIMGDGFFTMFKIYGAFNNGAFFAGKRGCDGSCGWGEVTFYDGQVFPVYQAFFGHIGHDAGADQVFGNYGEPGGIPVQAVAAAEDKRLSLILVVPCQGIGERIIGIPAGLLITRMSSSS